MTPQYCFSSDGSVLLLDSDVGHALDPIPPSDLSRFSISESAGITEPVPFGECQLYFLDMSSWSATGTFKDWVAAVVVAYAYQQGIHSFVSQSSGNTANALHRYCQEFGLDATILYPKASRYKIRHLDPSELVRLVEVDGSEPEVKAATRQLAGATEKLWLPSLPLQDIGNGYRANLVAQAARSGLSFDWHVQALSSAFGPIAFYRRWHQLNPDLPAPRFLGVQQAAVAPFVQLINGVDPDPHDHPIEPTLFRSDPTTELVERVREIVDRGGALRRVTSADFEHSLSETLRVMERAGMRLVKSVDASTGLLEAAPALATHGAISCIGDGTIAPGSNVLIAVTGGLRPLPERRYEPAFQWTPSDGLAALAALSRC